MKNDLNGMIKENKLRILISFNVSNSTSMIEKIEPIYDTCIPYNFEFYIFKSDSKIKTIKIKSNEIND